MSHNSESPHPRSPLQAPLPAADSPATLEAVRALLSTVQRLRAPDGCPWDREQTHQSLRPFLIEETYETIEILDQIQSAVDLKKEPLRQNFIEEWGDVLLQILLHAQIASETEPEIHLGRIAQELNQKLIRRHPHVFGETRATTSTEVIQNWEAIKKSEKKADKKENSPAKSVIDSIHRGLPPLPRTLKLIQKVTAVGFQWPTLEGPVQKLQEEVDELKAELGQLTPEQVQNREIPHRLLDQVESEMGDVLFSICNIAHFLKLDPETALRGTLRRFEHRFRYVEQKLFERGKTPQSSNLQEMDALWNESKLQEPK